LIKSKTDLAAAMCSKGCGDSYLETSDATFDPDNWVTQGLHQAPATVPQKR